MYKIIYLILIIIIYMVPFSATAEEKDNSSTATLPLNEILDLYKKIDELKTPQQPELPVNAIVHRIDLKGQLLEQAVDFQADIQVTVLADEQWVSVPLFETDTDTHISELPELHNVVLAHRNNTLELYTDKKGTYTFTLSFIKNAQTRGNKKVLNLVLKEASQSSLKLRFDENYVSMDKKNTHSITADGIIIYPYNNIYSLEWENKKIIKSRDSLVKKPEIESMIEEAHASVISTLEGKMIYRILYKLRFTGEKEISFRIPEYFSIEKVYINRILHAFTMKKDVLTLKIHPGRTGDQYGDVELIVSYFKGNYLLSGSIIIVLPKTSWTVHELFFTTHLPDVFDYTYKGGSLKQTDSTPHADYTYQIPLPGKQTYFHQYLIYGSFPSVTLDYTINLDGNYFIADERHNYVFE